MFSVRAEGGQGGSSVQWLLSITSVSSMSNRFLFTQVVFQLTPIGPRNGDVTDIEKNMTQA